MLLPYHAGSERREQDRLAAMLLRQLPMRQQLQVWSHNSDCARRSETGLRVPGPHATKARSQKTIQRGLTMFSRFCNWLCEHRRVGRRIGRLNLIYAQGRLILATLETLIEKVNQQETVIDGVTTLILGLKQQIADLSTGEVITPALQAKIDALGAELDQNAAKLAAAVGNTPTPEG